MSSPAAFQRNARKFNDYLSSRLTKTVTEHPLRPLFRPRTRPQAAFISFRGGEHFGDSPSVELGNGCHIQVSQIVLPNPQEPSGVTTAYYSYSYALSSNIDEDWILRYDYVPGKAADPEYNYPVAHVHFNGTSAAYDGFYMPGKRPLYKLHCPTERIAIESFIEHLIIELKVPTHGDRDEALAFLAESRREFHEKLRTK